MKTKSLTFMSTLLLLMTFSIACENEQTDELNDSYYWFGSEKVPLQKMTGKFHVLFYSINEEKLNAELAKNGVSLTDVKECSYGIDQTESGLQLPKDCKTASIEADYEKIESALSYTLNWSPYYKRIDNGWELRLEFLFYVQLKPGINRSQLEKLAKRNGVVIISDEEFLQGFYYLACTNLSGGNTLEMANFFYESGLFTTSSPSWGGNGELHNINI